MKKSIAIIGGGASALMFAAQIDENKFDTTIYERNAALGRKFLVAGDGGFNLTHSEQLEQFVTRYSPNHFFDKTISQFSNLDFQTWLKSIGIETFMGTSKRVFPKKGIKPIDVLNAILSVLNKKGIVIKTHHTWMGWGDDELLFETNNQSLKVNADIVVFALGGASWKVTGSDGVWASYFKQKGIEIFPFQASNCAHEIKWTKEFVETAEGKVLKNISLNCGTQYKKGELVITKFGLEGGAIYALSSAIRKELNLNGKATIFLDLKPQLTIEEIKNKLSNKGNKSLTKHLKDVFSFDNCQIALLKTTLKKDEFTTIEILSQKIKALPLLVTSVAPIDEAISVVGGVALNEIDDSFQLKKMKNNYVIGEMLDWDAPTGGYLLQNCVSMGYCLAHKLNQKIIVH